MDGLIIGQTNCNKLSWSLLRKVIIEEIITGRIIKTMQKYVRTSYG